MRRLRRFAVLVAVLLFATLACCSRSASAQGGEESSGIVPPVVPRSGAINVNSTTSRGAVKAIADCSGSANGTITVIGVGRSSGAPDVARIRMSVEATEPNAADARAKAAETTAAVMDALGAFAGAETRSNSLSVYPQRDHSSRDGSSRITGFQFRQSLTVSLSSPGSDNNSKKKSGTMKNSSSNNNDTAADSLASLASRALDAAIAAGGDRLSVDTLEFGMDAERQAAAVAEARARALVDLREKAERDAASLGLELGALATVKVDPYPRTGEPRGMRGSMAMASPEAKAGGPPTPLSSPDAETEVTAEGVYRVCSPS